MLEHFGTGGWTKGKQEKVQPRKHFIFAFQLNLALQQDVFIFQNISFKMWYIALSFWILFPFLKSFNFKTNFCFLFLCGMLSRYFDWFGPFALQRKWKAGFMCKKGRRFPKCFNVASVITPASTAVVWHTTDEQSTAI